MLSVPARHLFHGADHHSQGALDIIKRFTRLLSVGDASRHQ
jgi:hypothetical protein